MDTKLSFPLEIKKLEADGTFTGYGSVFDVEDSYKEIVKPGAFKKSLAKWRAKGLLPPMLWQHDTRLPIGKYTVMKEDGQGLYVEGKLLVDSLQLAKDAYALLKEKVVTGLSIGFVTKKHEWDNEKRTRSLLEVDLWELSLVTFPANEQAGVTAVKAVDEVKTVRDFEEMLRTNGFTDREAVLIASKGFTAALDARDSRQNRNDAGEPQDLSKLAAALQRRNTALGLNN
jgi:HK97 family phage prohead protease